MNASWQMPEGYVLTPVTGQHTDILWFALELRTTEENTGISHRAMPTREAHNAFVRYSPYWNWWLVSESSGQVFIADLRVGFDNSLGIFVWPEHRRAGHARRLLSWVTTTLKPLPASPARRPGHWVANINPANDASIRLFEQVLGFRLVQHTYALETAP